MDLTQKKRGDPDQVHGRGIQVRMEAETAATHYQLRKVKDCQQPPEIAGGKENFFPRAFRGSLTLIA